MVSQGQEGGDGCPVLLWGEGVKRGQVDTGQDGPVLTCTTRMSQ